MCNHAHHRDDDLDGEAHPQPSADGEELPCLYCARTKVVLEDDGQHRLVPAEPWQATPHPACNAAIARLDPTFAQGQPVPAS